MTDDNTGTDGQSGGQGNDGGQHTDGAGQQQNGQGAGQVNGQSFTQADVDRIVADRLTRAEKKYADYGDLKAKAEKLATLEAASQTDLERAVGKAAKDAEEKGRVEERAAGTERLVRAEFRAAVGGRMKDTDLDAVLGDLNLTRFVDDKGEPDMKAIKAAADRWAPAGNATDFDAGARSTAKTNDMDALIRQQAGRR
jgi:hypothetical protein